MINSFYYQKVNTILQPLHFESVTPTKVTKANVKIFFHLGDLKRIVMKSSGIL